MNAPARIKPPLHIGRTKCVNCGAPAITLRLRPVTDSYIESVHQCSSDDCDMRFVMGLSLVRVIRESRKPNPALHIPRGQHRETTSAPPREPPRIEPPPGG